MNIECNNPDCRTTKRGKSKSDFCPTCKGKIALKYNAKHKISIKKAKIVVMSFDPCSLDKDDMEQFSDMYSKAEVIDSHRFLRRVSLVYINAYFGYKSARSKGLMFKDDKSLKFYESKYMKCGVLIMEKDGMHYIFAQPLVFGAAILYNEPSQTYLPMKVMPVPRNPYSPFDDSLEEHQSFSG